MFAGVAFSSYGGFWLGLGIYGTLAQACALRFAQFTEKLVMRIVCCHVLALRAALAEQWAFLLSM